MDFGLLIAPIARMSRLLTAICQVRWSIKVNVKGWPKGARRYVTFFVKIMPWFLGQIIHFPRLEKRVDTTPAA
jgi:hypothetical protein